MVDIVAVYQEQQTSNTHWQAQVSRHRITNGIQGKSEAPRLYNRTSGDLSMCQELLISSTISKAGEMRYCAASGFNKCLWANMKLLNYVLHSVLIDNHFLPPSSAVTTGGAGTSISSTSHSIPRYPSLTITAFSFIDPSCSGTLKVTRAMFLPWRR